MFLIQLTSAAMLCCRDFEMQISFPRVMMDPETNKQMKNKNNAYYFTIYNAPATSHRREWSVKGDILSSGAHAHDPKVSKLCSFCVHLQPALGRLRLFLPDEVGPQMGTR